MTFLVVDLLELLGLSGKSLFDSLYRQFDIPTESKYLPYAFVICCVKDVVAKPLTNDVVNLL